MSKTLADNDFTILSKLDFDAPLIILNADEKMAKEWKERIQSSLEKLDKIEKLVESMAKFNGGDYGWAFSKSTEQLQDILNLTKQTFGKGDNDE